MTSKKIRVWKATSDAPPKGNSVAKKQSRKVLAALEKLKIAQANAGATLNKSLEDLAKELPSWVASGLFWVRELAERMLDSVPADVGAPPSSGSSVQEQSLASTLSALHQVIELSQKVEGMESTCAVASEAVRGCLDSVVQASRAASAAQAEECDFRLWERRLELKIRAKENGLILPDLDGALGIDDE